MGMHKSWHPEHPLLCIKTPTWSASLGPTESKRFPIRTTVVSGRLAAMAPAGVVILGETCTQSMRTVQCTGFHHVSVCIH